MNVGDTVELRPQFTKTCLVKGSAITPQDGQKCTVKYKGTLDDGTVFDASESFSFYLNEGYVIKGWDIGVATMGVGERSVLHVPHLFGYGDASVGSIPPKAALTFEIELLDVRDGTFDKVKWQLLSALVFMAFIVYYAVNLKF